MDQSKDVLVHFTPGVWPLQETSAGDEVCCGGVCRRRRDGRGSMDAVANDVPGLDIEGFPTLIIFTKSNKRGIEYDGSRDLHDIVQFIKDARAGINYVGGLKDELAGSREQDDELERDAKVEL